MYFTYFIWNRINNYSKNFYEKIINKNYLLFIENNF